MVLTADEYRAIGNALDARSWRERRAGGSGFLYRLALDTIDREHTVTTK